MKQILTVALMLGAAACQNQPVSRPASDAPSLDDPAVERNAVPYLERGYAAMRAEQVSGVDYSLSIVLNDHSDRFEGTVVAEFDLAAGNRAPVTVDFNGGRIDAVRLNGERVEYDYNDLFIALSDGLDTGGRNRLEVQYSRRYATDGDGLHRFVDLETDRQYLYTNFEPFNANKLFPHFDQPDIKARYTLDVIAPQKWHVISATREERVTDMDGRRHWFFPRSARISSYIFPLHAGPYRVWKRRYRSEDSEIALRLFARPEIADHVVVDDWFTFTEQSFGFFDRYFDLPYVFGKYDQVIVPDFNAGAMENLAAVTFTEKFVSRGEKTEAERIRLANVIAHEMAHMWFGNLVTMDWWNGLWLNESFATYMAYLELDRASDFEDTWDVFYSRTKQWAYQTDQQVTTHPIELPVPTTSDAFTNFDGITYGKGASVLKQLPHFLGEEHFRRGVSNYLREHAYGNTNLQDFTGALGAAAGKDLTRWTRQWLYEAGLNSLQAAYRCEQGRLAGLTLKQTAPPDHPTLRAQRVQVGLFAVNAGSPARTLAALPVTYRDAETEVNVPANTPCPDLVYPNAGDWGYVKVLLDDRSRDTLLSAVNRFEDDSLRIMLWQSLWDGVRDVDMALDDFGGFTAANIPVETDKRIVAQVAYQLKKSSDYLWLIDPDGQDGAGLRGEIAGLMWRQVEAAPPGSDRQKIWFDRWAEVGAREVDLARMRRLLKGEASIAGLDLDPDRRWSLVIALNRFAFRDYGALTRAESERDGSERGRLKALAAQASRPEAAIKQQWLDRIVQTPGQYKLAELTEAMRHLFPASQPVLMERYAGRILQALPDLAAGRDDRFLDRYADNLLPATCRASSVERLSGAIDRYTGLNPTVDKAMRIARQDDERCVAIGRLLTAERKNR